MLSRLLSATALLVATAVPCAAACTGADPAITSAKLQSMSSGSVNNVHMAVTVKNVGTKGQPSNTLQSVAIYQNATKVGMKGVPPLAPGQMNTFVYTFSRSDQAPAGSTPFRLQLIVKQPANADCNPANDSYHVRV